MVVELARAHTVLSFPVEAQPLEEFKLEGSLT
jgi:hypothetical protein